MSEAKKEKALRRMKNKIFLKSHNYFNSKPIKNNNNNNNTTVTTSTTLVLFARTSHMNKTKKLNTLFMNYNY